MQYGQATPLRPTNKASALSGPGWGGTGPTTLRAVPPLLDLLPVV